jgi:hypothetical protein
VTECPDLAPLEAGALSPELEAHVSACPSCRVVVEVFEQRREDKNQCLQFELLLAARADGTIGRAGANLLTRHLASCESCRAVAETMSPSADEDGDLDQLPQVDPASYALGLEVARGGMGRILAARDLRVGRPVAVKELLGRSRMLSTRFEREARVTARLQHPGIVPIYEIGRWPDGTPFYTMRMIEGRTLLKAIGAASTLSARLALLPSLIAATEAVAFAHAQQVIHRDLTPSNVMVGPYGETLVIDWGLAKDLADERAEAADVVPHDTDQSTEGLTRAGAVLGTAAYMPPEQANGQHVDRRADVYALGAILYHLLAGTAPYRALRSDELLHDVKERPPRSVDEIAPDAPRDLVSIVAKAMARDPDGRYPSARELADELKRFQTGRMVEAHEYTTFERVKRFVRRNKAAVGAALAIVIALVAATVVSTGQARRADEQAKRADEQAARAVEEARRAQIETERAHKAEAETQLQLEKLQAEQAARAAAEQTAREKGDEAQLSRDQLVTALAKARDEKRLAEDAEQRAEASARAEKATREAAEALYEKAQAHVKELEQQSKKITNRLP